MGHSEYAIRFWLDRERRLRDRAMFDLAIDSKLRGCDVVKVKIGDLISGGRVRTRAIVIQQKTGRPVQFELLEPARGSILAWLERRGGTLDDFVFPSRIDHADHISTRQYARLVDEWVTGIGLRREDYGTHSLRRTKASIILNPAVGVGRAGDFCDFSTKSCCVSRARGVAASATDGPEGKLGRLSRGFAASVAGPSTAPHFLPARAKKWRQRETPSRPESPSRVNSLR